MTDPDDRDDDDDDERRDISSDRAARATTATERSGTEMTSMCSVSPQRRVFVASAVAAVGGVLFGYDTGTVGLGTHCTYRYILHVGTTF